VVILKIIAIIPTHKRNSDFNRAFDSISNQSRPADRILIVHEKEDDYPHLLSGNKIHATINKRTKSLSGAINHAIDEIILNRHDWKIEPDSTWFALLDDDDWWDAEYLEKCVSLVDEQCHQVVAGLTRYDLSNPEGFNLSVPEELQCDSFLIKNPHIQGSNLFVRMDSFLAAGGFDESILSCTDRDFCIRLFENKNHHWKRLNQHLVHHDARKPGRISDPNSKRKTQGIQRFAMKHQFRMDEEQWDEFLQVTKERFGIELDQLDSHTVTGLSKERGTENPHFEEGIEHYDLTIGVTFSDLGLAEKFVDSLKKIIPKWPHRTRLVACLHKINPSEIDSIFQKANLTTLELIIYDEKSATELANAGGLGPWFLNEKYRTGVSWGRCVLHRRILDQIGNDNRPLIWILDEDMQLHLCNSSDPKCKGFDAFLQTVWYMEKFGIDVGIGHVIGDPPIHPLFTLRTQVLDLHYSRMMEKSGFLRIKWGLENLNDIHHDLSTSRFDHLEFPWGLFNLKSNNSDALRLIKSGKFSSRPVHSDWRQRFDEDLLIRGGNTIVLDPTSLSEWSNMAPLISNIQTRRGDSIWSLYAQRIKGKTVGKEERKVAWVPFAVPQERKNSPISKHDIDNIRGDIIGSMIMRNLSQIFSLKNMEMNRTLWDDGGWEKEFSENVVVDSKLRESRLISSLYRVAALEQHLENESSILEIAKEFFHSKIGGDIEAEIEKIFKEMPAHMSRFRSAQPKIRPRYRISEAVVKLEKLGYTDFEIRGDGSEGVVLKKADLAIKVHHAGFKLNDECLNLMGELSTTSVSFLPKNFAVLNKEPLITSYNWVEGEHPFFETNIACWLNLLRECRQQNIVYWDIKPQNLVLTPEGELVIIDLGRDLKPFTEQAWQSMVRKSFLCWRWWFRPDLRSLLTQSIRMDTPEKMPELTDIDYFFQAIEIHDKADLHDPWFIELIREYKPGKLLDWGCGKGTLSKQIADIGFSVEGWDPITGHMDRVEAQSKVKWIDGKNSVRSGYYDTVIATLVLWVIEDENEVVEVLRTMRRAVSESGKVIASVCHPLQMCTQCSTSVERPSQQMELGRLTFEKRIRSTNRIRTEHVRSLERVEMLATRANLRISRLIESPGVDVNRCAPMPEYLAIEFEPITEPKHTDVELLILACSMDHSIIVKQVRHIVNQLGGTRRFQKVSIITDEAETGFSRGWSEPNLDQFKVGLDQLIEEEVIDQVLWAPKNDAEIRQLNERWYGVSSPINKAVNGQPVHTSLWGLEQMSSSYVLQIDSDIMFHRDWAVDPTDLLVDCLIEREAVTATLPILSDPNCKPHLLDGIEWRTEVRFCIFNRSKMFQMLPLDNTIVNDKWRLPWHKTMDSKISQNGSGSLRLANGKNWFLHPQNEDKKNALQLYRIRRRIERGEISVLQKGHVDLVSWDDLDRIRNEQIVVIVRGRNTPYSLVKRHIQSLRTQTNQDFGVIWIDASSDDYSPPHVEYDLDVHFGNRITYIWNEIPRSRCENIILAMEYISNQEAIVILLDADDAFAGPEVISHVRDVFADGIEVAVGGMLRLDKHQSYPVDFQNPRANRGGNVWQHLKCFRKRCMEVVPIEMFKLDNQFIHDEDDWALMLPIVEASMNHHLFTRPMMIYTISKNKMLRSHEERDERIARIVSKPSLLALHNTTQSALDSYLEILKKSRGESGIMLLRHSIRPSFKGMPEEGRDDVSLTYEGREMAINAGGLIGEIGTVLSSPVLRCIQTAEHILSKATITPSKSLCGGPFGKEWVKLKEEVGWSDAIRKWLNGDFRGSQSVQDVGRNIVQYLIESHKIGQNTLAVSHDVAILAVAEHLGIRNGASAVPELGGIFIRDDILEVVL
jgi:broad specificity phosphatase PhoE/2-polyprenyl-3-methyl-5-hydroxy-6-metoxy-1,4-benzoquinol methylase/GT2 family glycosyltransferase